MLDSVTKKRIDDLRNILVGKIPSPQSQVEQITTGLIYKFMYDMDQEAVDMGGVPSFFVNDYEKYSWQNLFDPKLSGVQKVQLYSDAIEHMYTNPTAPQLFREIFKNSFLPFKDPATLNMFLKEINEFHYSHSEKLGDAFEYLLSFMGSQGDAGQFRTPRHIIDFVVDLVNPQKNENILDPACGTAGFLISSYKHILKQNTNKKLGDQLTASDRKRIGENLVGYDISPDMTRISLVNMYLHQFASPQIHEYDTLSSEDRWNEYYDVILANPPFFSPTGGIQPHSRFGVQSTRAEVLFVDYIMEHLKPTGRAGIIVPEGILFQVGNAYKTLRKKLIEDSLIGVISLPSGIFQPYSGVKTSILILNKEKNKNSDNIFFAKIDNDGFGLGAQRNPIEKNDIPEVLECLFSNVPSEKIKYISKDELLNSPVISLTGNSNIKEDVQSDFNLAKLSDVTNIKNGFAFKSNLYQPDGYRVIRITNVQTGEIEDSDPRFHPKLNTTEHEKYELSAGDILISLTGNVGRVGRVTPDLLPAYLNQRVGMIQSSDLNIVSNDFLFWILNNKKFENDCINNSSGVAQKNLSTNWIKDYQIPIPSRETQDQIVKELQDYQKIIDGSKQIVDNFKPSISIDPSWNKLRLSDLGETKSGGTPSRTDLDYWDGGIPWYSSGELNNLYTENPIESISERGLNNSNCKVFPKGSLLIGMYDTAAFKMSILDRDATFNQAIYGITPNEKIDVNFLYLFLMTEKEKYLNDRVGVRQRNLSKTYIDQIEVLLPPVNEQILIVEKYLDELTIVNGCKKLIKIYSEKIQSKIDSLWDKR
jgi:type I restriction enzyme M protein